MPDVSLCQPCSSSVLPKTGWHRAVDVSGLQAVLEVSSWGFMLRDSRAVAGSPMTAWELVTAMVGLHFDDFV